MAAIATDVVQAAIGSLHHRHMAPSHASNSPAASLAYLAYGSTVLWLYCYSLFSFLPFRLQLLQQVSHRTPHNRLIGRGGHKDGAPLLLAWWRPAVQTQLS